MRKNIGQFRWAHRNKLGFRPLNSLTQRDGKKQKVADNREGYQQKGIALGVDPG